MLYTHSKQFLRLVWDNQYEESKNEKNTILHHDICIIKLFGQL